jgi:hypothetical protein
MNSDENVVWLKRCVCGRMHARPGRYCSRECRMVLAEFWEFCTLRTMLRLSRWTGGKSQKQLQAEYYAQQLRDAVERLSESEDLLGAVLVEILEELDLQ